MCLILFFLFHSYQTTLQYYFYSISNPFFLKQTIQLYFSFFQIISILFSFTLCLYFYPLNQNKMNNHVLFWVGSSLEESLCIHFVCCMLYFYVLFVLSKFMWLFVQGLMNLNLSLIKCLLWFWFFFFNLSKKELQITENIYSFVKRNIAKS